MAPLAHHFRSGDVVTIKSAEEIRATLKQGALEGALFMDEMYQYCGRTFRVFKRADKVCVEQDYYLDYRRMKDAVLLEEVRCDGTAHDGCEKLCMIFWKEAWLEPARAGAEPEPPIDWSSAFPRPEAPPIDEWKTYVCQSTTLRGATQGLRMWDPRQYARDLESRALRPRELARVLFVMGYNRVAQSMKRKEFRAITGVLDKTPEVKLALKPKDKVRVLNRQAIASTLDKKGRNRGLFFGTDMNSHCGHTLEVITPVSRIILETNGKMKALKNTVLLNGAACSGMCNRGCARNGHPLWREAWLEPLEEAAPVSVMEPPAHSGVVYKGPGPSPEDEVRVATAAANAQAAPRRPSLRVMKPRNSSI